MQSHTFSICFDEHTSVIKHFTARAFMLCACCAMSHHGSVFFGFICIHSMGLLSESRGMVRMVQLQRCGYQGSLHWSLYFERPASLVVVLFMSVNSWCYLRQIGDLKDISVKHTLFATLSECVRCKFDWLNSHLLVSIRTPSVLVQHCKCWLSTFEMLLCTRTGCAVCSRKKKCS